MTSTDREILLEINGRIMRMESRLENVESRVEGIERRLDIQGTKLEDLQTSVYCVEGKFDIALWSGGICFAVIAAMITFASIYVPMLLRKPEAESKSPEIYPTITLDAVERIAAMIRGQASSTPSNDTRTLPSSTANS